MKLVSVFIYRVSGQYATASAVFYFLHSMGQALIVFDIMYFRWFRLTESAGYRQYQKE